MFACLNDETVPLHEWLGDVPTRLASYKLDGWVSRERATFTIEANWKLISENYQEYYHLPFVHPELAKVSRVEDHYRYQGPGMYCGQTTTPVSSDDRDDWTAMPPAPGLDAGDAVSGRFLALFPNVLLSVLPNHAFVIILEPIGPGRTIERAVWLLPPASKPTDGEFVTTRDFWIAVNDEDIAEYVATTAGFDKAGGLALQAEAGGFIDRTEGCWSNVLGLPVCAVAALLDLDPAGATRQQRCSEGRCRRPG